MDRDGAVEESAAGSGQAAGPAFVLPSRAAAIAACRVALDSGAGPVLVTGEAGVGKTWLGARLAEDRSARTLSLSLDLSPSTDPAALFRSIGHGLGLAGLDFEADPRLAVADELRDQAADGRRWTLILDEAQAAADAVLEEVRILSNRLGRPDGFDGLALLGQTRLARRLATRPLAGLSARIAARAHLRPIDADEARDLLARVRPRSGLGLDEVERLHRDAQGNPRRLLRLAGSVGPLDGPAKAFAPSKAVRTPELEANPRPDPTPIPIPLPAAADEAVPLLGPTRPPIHLGDNLIEVGWEPPAATDQDEGQSPAVEDEVEDEDGPEPAMDEPVQDHYAAIQAWNEWARNQERVPASHPSPALSDPAPDLFDDDETPNPAAQARLLGNLWAEGPEKFAPYGQLFSRLRQPNDPD